MRHAKDLLHRSILAGLLAGAVGCADATTAPPVTPHRVANWLASPQLPAIRARLADASDRLVRPISEATRRARLESEIRLLSEQLDAGDVDGAERYLALVRRDLDGAAAAGVSEPDIAAFAAALDGVQQLISGSSTLSGDDK